MICELSMADVRRYRSQGEGRVSGEFLRFYCPVHGSDKQLSLSVRKDNGYFKCFVCGAKGFLSEFKAEYFRGKIPPPRVEHTTAATRINHQNDSATKQLITLDRSPLLAKFQRELIVGSEGHRYVSKRGLSFDLAAAHGLGYAPPGTWPGGAITCSGRMVFPHNDVAHKTVNIYGRAIDDRSPRHLHLSGPKGVFNVGALSQETAYVCEGAIDAMSLIAAGYPDSCAIFGVYGLRWDWITAKEIIFCFDQDTAGEKFKLLAWEGLLRGKKVYQFPWRRYPRRKDMNEIWVTEGAINP